MPLTIKEFKQFIKVFKREFVSDHCNILFEILNHRIEYRYHHWLPVKYL